MIRISGKRANFLFLTFAQGIKLLFLVVSIYVSTKVDLFSWGQYTISQSIFLWVSLSVEYGFNLYGIGQLSKIEGQSDNNLHKELVAKIYSGRLFIGMIIILVSVIFLIIYPSVFIINSSLYFLSIVGAIAYGMLPTWYYQFRDSIYVIAIADIIIFSISTIAFFFVIFFGNSLIEATFVQSIACVTATVIFGIYTFDATGHPRMGFGAAMRGVSDAFNLFVYNSSIGLYTAGSNIIIGYFFGVQQSGSFSSAERIVRMINSIFAPFIKIYFPKMSILYNSNIKLYRKSFSRIMFVSIPALIIIALIFYGQVNLVVAFIYKDNAERIAEVARILSLTIILVNVSSLVAFFWILPVGLSSTFNKITFVSAFINILLLYIAKEFGKFDFVWSIIWTELFVLISIILMSILVRRKEST